MGGPALFKRPAAKLMALRAAAGRLVTLGRSASDQLEWALLEADGTQVYPAEAGTNAPLAPAAGGFDAATLGTRAFLVAGEAGLTIFRVSNLDAEPVPGSAVSAGQIAALASFDGKQLAAAAGQGRLAVAWVNHVNGDAGPAGAWPCSSASDQEQHGRGAGQLGQGAEGLAAAGEHVDVAVAGRRRPGPCGRRRG